MTMDDGSNTFFGDEPWDVTDRVQAQLRRLEMEPADLFSEGILSPRYRGMMDRLLRREFATLDEVRPLLDELSVKLACDFVSGDQVSDDSRRGIEAQRLGLYGLVEQFLAVMAIKGERAAAFTTYVMKRFEPCFQKKALGVYSERVPDCVTEIADLFGDWLRQGSPHN